MPVARLPYDTRIREVSGNPRQSEAKRRMLIRTGRVVHLGGHDEPRLVSDRR
jgi:hypothetical protein